MNRTAAEQLADKIINLLSEWAGQERGRKTQLVQAVQDAAGGDSPPTRVLIESWIHPDVEKRRNPTLPNGLLLIATGFKIGALRRQDFPKWKTIFPTSPQPK